MPLSPDSRDSSIERLIGWLTIALGVGMLIPRPGLGLYSVLEQTGTRAYWAAAMNVIGLWLVIASFYAAPIVRILLLVTATVCWVMLAFRFIDGQLWGATFQACVVIFFCNSTGWRLWRHKKSA
jgi:hypothetical protein